MIKLRRHAGTTRPGRTGFHETAFRCVYLAIPWLFCAPAYAAEGMTGWRDVVRQTPLWESQGAQANLTTIRRWVLAGEGFCEEPERHILFDRRMRFVGYLSDAGARRVNQDQINLHRAQLASEGRVPGWAPGDENRIGYPFVLSCHQPDAQLRELVAGYLGEEPSARLWGTWDGMRVGTKDAEVSLHQAIREVYQYRRDMGRIDLPEQVLFLIAGKVIIESGGVREARSAAGAQGIMQLSTEVLRDCRIDDRFKLHRLAQIDCALYLLQQNNRVLKPSFEQRFGHLPARKRDLLFRMLLVQAYHTGIGRVVALLSNEALNGPAQYFAQHHERFTAGDMTLGMVFHNLGREKLGFASLYYVTDVFIAAEAACRRVASENCTDQLSALMGQKSVARSR